MAYARLASKARLFSTAILLASSAAAFASTSAVSFGPGLPTPSLPTTKDGNGTKVAFGPGLPTPSLPTTKDGNGTAA